MIDGKTNNYKKQSSLVSKPSKLPVKIFTFDPEGQQKFLHPAAKQNNHTMQNEKKKNEWQKKHSLPRTLNYFKGCSTFSFSIGNSGKV